MVKHPLPVEFVHRELTSHSGLTYYIVVAVDRCHLDNSNGSSGALEKEEGVISASSQGMASPRVASEALNAIAHPTRE
jgi:hypothetical protein